MTYCSHNLPFEIRCPDCREEAFLRERQRMLTPPTRQAECGSGAQSSAAALAYKERISHPMVR